MKSDRRKFLIGGVGLSTSLALPAGADAVSDAPVSAESPEFERYLRFLAYEHLQALRMKEIHTRVYKHKRPVEEAYRNVMEKGLDQPLHWFPDDCPDVVSLCTGNQVTPLHRAKGVLRAAGL